MGKLSQALGLDMGDESPPSSADAGDDSAMEKPKGVSAEVLAMKQFDRAGDPEAKVTALRDLLEAMGVC